MSEPCFVSEGWVPAFVSHPRSEDEEYYPCQQDLRWLGEADQVRTQSGVRYDASGAKSARIAKKSAAALTQKLGPKVRCRVLIKPDGWDTAVYKRPLVAYKGRLGNPMRRAKAKWCKFFGVDETAVQFLRSSPHPLSKKVVIEMDETYLDLRLGLGEYIVARRCD